MCQMCLLLMYLATIGHLALGQKTSLLELIAARTHYENKLLKISST